MRCVTAVFVTITHMECSDAFSPALLPPLPSPSTLKLFIVDGNLPQETITAIAQHAFHHSIPCMWEPTSIEKSERGQPAFLQGLFTLCTPSSAELLAMAERVGYTQAGKRKEKWAGAKGRDRYLSNDEDDAVRQQATALLSAVRPPPAHPSRYIHLVVKRGGRGVLLASRRLTGEGGRVEVEIHDVTTRKLDRVVSTSGAGDTLCGAMAGRLLSNRGRVGDEVREVLQAIKEGMRAAELTLMSHRSVSPELTREKLHQLTQMDPS